ncbi:MAG: acetolactate synthase I/II/III large subunit [Rhodobacteraceae bacterium HLUCCO07]|nr:MAG: acetolactate synthase I/II/III large subunit [Rhodobacteraceae bacterium HLUCCO07]
MAQTGADILARVLARNGVDTCFANPGTTEMHLVSSFTHDLGIACHLCLFEGVATGAADGYARMARKPAATLLHLGPGLANGIANLHNARKAASPIINIVGEHAVDHIAHDAPLTADIEGLARPVSKSVTTLRDTGGIDAAVTEMLAEIRTGPTGVGTLIVPNDIAWSAAQPSNLPPASPPMPTPPDAAAVAAAAKALQEPGALLLLGSPHITRRAIELGHAIAAKTGATLRAEAATARTSRGGGLPELARVPFQIDAALDALADTRHAILAGARAPVAFFAYPERPSALLPEGCAVTRLSPPEGDLEAALAALADHLDAKPVAASAPAMPPLPRGAITPEALGAAVANALPEGAIVADESVTNGPHLQPACAASPAHDWLNNRGGSIGYSMPVAVGAAAACPDRPVLAVVGDGSASYTPQALWTMARAGMNVTVVILSNRRYRILATEMSRIGAGEPDEHSDPLMSLDNPPIEWVAQARTYGVPGVSVSHAQDLHDELARAFTEPGPHLIEARM